MCTQIRLSNLPRLLHRTFSGRPRARLSLRLAAHLASVSEVESARWCELCVPERAVSGEFRVCRRSARVRLRIAVMPL